MKIKTKLLLALWIISLFPPMAAYFALIGNPGISFALHTTEYEAQQGVAAQRLHRHELPADGRIRAQDVLGGLHHEYWLEEIAA
jgi:hypothetical protein